MHKKTISFTIIAVILVTGVIFAQDFIWEDISRGNNNIEVIAVHPQNNEIIFAGVSGSILKSDNAGESWRRVLSIRGGLNNINALAFDSLDPSVIYAATDNSLYRSKNSGQRWERIFRGKNNVENQCTAVLSTAYAIFVGTGGGVFISRDKGSSWQKEDGKINNTVIFNIDFNPRLDRVVYLSASCGIFKSLDNGENWERIYVAYSQNDTQEERASDKAEEENSLLVHFVKTDPNNINCVYFSCTRGVYKSLDQGKTWSKLSESGLLFRDVKLLCINDKTQVFALTRSGVFHYKQERWEEVAFRPTAGRLNYFALDNKSTIYIAGERGIFKSSPEVISGISEEVLLKEYLKYEPRIIEVQKAAIRYAEVSSEKISQWRKKAAIKALLPQVSAGLDSNSTDLWHWETGSTTKNDDDSLRRGKKSLDWDIALSWDLSDLIWSEAQTSIDVRSKLMVELRDDILDQVNKLYYERLRLRSELDNLGIEDRGKRFDKQLRLAELTASLDSLTDGYYSEQLQLIMAKK